MDSFFRAYTDDLFKLPCEELVARDKRVSALPATGGVVGPANHGGVGPANPEECWPF